MVTPEDYAAYARELGEHAGDDAQRAAARREAEFAEVYAQHDRMLADAGALDFGGLILQAYRLLHERPHVRDRLAERFKAVLVDEYQDTNFAQVGPRWKRSLLALPLGARAGPGRGRRGRAARDRRRCGPFGGLRARALGEGRGHDSRRGARGARPAVPPRGRGRVLSACGDPRPLGV